MTTDTKQVLSTLVNSMSESETLKMARMARELKSQGHDVISLSLGEPDFDTPDHIKNAASEALKAGYTKYTPVAGLPELVEAIKTKFSRDNNLFFDANQIVVSNGAKQSIYNLCMAMLDPGDEVIVFTPYWVSYSDIIRMTGATPIFLKATVEQDFKVTAEQLREAITPKTKFILFSSPCNPTGSVFSEQELIEIANVVASVPDLYIISDEIYEYIQFESKHFSIGAIENVKDRTITVNGFAKGFAMTGWRLGYIGAPKFIAEACTKIQGQVTSGASSFGQKAAAIALMSDMTPTHKMCEAFKARRDLVVPLINAIPGLKVNNPSGAFYVFPDASEYFGTFDGAQIIRNSDDLCDYLMMKAHVGVVSGTAFGDPDCFRLSYAASEAQLVEAIRRIKEALNNLKRLPKDHTHM
jgi:aspartate aminotransferase